MSIIESVKTGKKKPKLFVAFVGVKGTITGKAFALLDSNGEMLPLQVETRVDTGFQDLPTITVKFLIDGTDIAFTDDLEEALQDISG